MRKKELNQDDFYMKIIKDLGMIENDNGTKHRKAIFECMDCKAEVTCIVHNAKKRTNKKYCNKCKAKNHSISLIKPLNESNYKMKLIKDLGVLPTPNGVRKQHYGLFECNTCKKHFKALALSNTAFMQTQCKECANKRNANYKHPLYSIWNGIKQRCYSNKRKDYNRYGGRGVTMCDEWKNNAQSFIDWCLSNGWKQGLEVDKDIKCRELNISPTIYAKHTITFITSSKNSTEARGKTVVQFSLDGKKLKEFDSTVLAGKHVNRDKSTIQKACRGENKTCAGYIWKYK